MRGQMEMKEGVKDYSISLTQTNAFQSYIGFNLLVLMKTNLHQVCNRRIHYCNLSQIIHAKCVWAAQNCDFIYLHCTRDQT